MTEPQPCPRASSTQGQEALRSQGDPSMVLARMVLHSHQSRLKPWRLSPCLAKPCPCRAGPCCGERGLHIPERQNWLRTSSHHSPHGHTDPDIPVVCPVLLHLLVLTQVPLLQVLLGLLTPFLLSHLRCCIYGQSETDPISQIGTLWVSQVAPQQAGQLQPPSLCP